MARFKRFHARIQEKAKDGSTAPVLIVALGDSVTQGCMEEGRMDFDAVYHNQLKRLLEQRYPGTTFSFINAGFGGESAPGGLTRLERDVIPHQPDLVIIGYGLNDACGGGLAGVDAFRVALASMISRIKTETDAAILMLTPNRMATHDNDGVAARWKPIIGNFVKTQVDGVVAAYAEAIRRVASDQAVAVADIYSAWTELELSGRDTTFQLCNGINHPDAEMHQMTARIIMKEIENEK